MKRFLIFAVLAVVAIIVMNIEAYHSKSDSQYNYSHYERSYPSVYSHYKNTKPLPTKIQPIKMDSSLFTSHLDLYSIKVGRCPIAAKSLNDETSAKMPSRKSQKSSFGDQELKLQEKSPYDLKLEYETSLKTKNSNNMPASINSFNPTLPSLQRFESKLSIDTTAGNNISIPSDINAPDSIDF